MISIIIPTLNEEKSIRKTLQAIKRQPQKKEILVVDGNSKDKTVQYARQLAKVIASPRGRARQMNLGAKHARGDILLFLHADTILPNNAFAEIKRKMNDDTCVGGGFCQKFDEKNWLLNFISWKANVRAKQRKLIFGDQAIFIKKKTFNQIGGFKKVSLMEDVELSKAIKKLGKIAVIKTPVITSARKFRKLGILKAWLLMGLMRSLHFFHVDTKTLHKLYTRG